MKSKKSRKSKTSTQMKKAADKAQTSLKHEPLTMYLRPANIVGGGFPMTGAGRIPKYVLSYWDLVKHKT